jgi:hypothetical protein
VRDDVTWERYRNDIAMLDRSNLAAFEEMAKMIPALSYKDAVQPPPAFRDMEAIIDHLLEKLAAVSLKQAIVVDLPSQLDDFAFVYVCVPGLEFAANKPNYTPGARMLAFLESIGRPAIRTRMN